MAAVQIYRYEFVQNHSTFSAGDILDVFLDPDLTDNPAFISSTGITVNLNGSSYPASGSGFIVDLSPTTVITQDFGVQACNGTALISLSRFTIWPYAAYSTLEGHPLCAVTPEGCDLIVVGVPDVIPCTTESSADGSITVTASSSNPIQYKLASDFVYADGSAQTDGYFQGLLPGTYRIYLRDSKNCGVSVQVIVPVNNLYGPIRRLEYTDVNGWSTRLDITKRGYSGTVTEMCGAGTPFIYSLRGEGSTDKFESILAISSQLNLTSELDGEFHEIYTNDANLYRLEFFKRVGTGTPTEITLPGLSSWFSSSLDGDRPDWTTGAIPSVTLAGTGGLSFVTSEFLYTDFAFVNGNHYTITINYTYTVNSGNFNPRSARLRITDSSFNIIFSEVQAASSGANSLSVSFTATAECECIAFQFASGSNVTITVSSVSGTEGGHQFKHVTKLLPNQAVEEYRAAPYYVSFHASDGLTELKDTYLIQNNGHKYYGTIKEIKLVAHCLKATGLSLPIRVACNLYAVTMDQGDEDDPLDQAYCDFEAFYLAEKEPKLDFVLHTILNKYGAQIIQWEGRWNITRVEEKKATHDYREFDFDGNYVTHGTFNPVIDIAYPSENGVMLANRNSVVETRPGYGYIKAFYHLGLKPNILKNGDFRLNVSLFDNTYSASINTEGWTLANAGYSLSETYESITQDNIAYKIIAGSDSSSHQNAGKAYLQGESQVIRMGSNNQLKFGFRYKVDRVSVTFGGIVYQFDAEYVKVRVRVKYGDLYLQSNGSWTAKENIISFNVNEFNQYIESELVARQPVVPPHVAGTYFAGQFVSYDGKSWACKQNGVSSTPSEGSDWTEITVDPVTGQEMDVRMYIAHPFYTDFQDVEDLEEFPTYHSGSSTELIPTGYTTELRDEFTFPSYIYFYKLEETTDSASGYQIIRPDDYHATANPRQWVLQKRSLIFSVAGADTYPFSIDSLKCSFLTDGKDPIDTIVRSQPAEGGNKEVFDVDLYLGSYSTLVVSEVSFGIGVGFFSSIPGLALSTTNILSADTIYAGWLRDADGNGFENWARDGVAESDKLHAILLKQYTSQYRKSWKLFRGDFYAKGQYFGFLNVARLVDDDNTIYMPIGLELDDKNCIYSGELLEISTGSGGSDGSGSSPFNIEFNSEYGDSEFN